MTRKLIHTTYSKGGYGVRVAIIDEPDLRATFMLTGANTLLAAPGMPDPSVDTGHHDDEWQVVDDAEFDAEFGGLVTAAQIREALRS
jgi:hypothetical protein